MTANLLLGFPQITIDATAVTTSTDEDEDSPAKNLILGGRGQHFRLEAAAVEAWAKFDLGSSLEKTIDFYYVARADLLKDAGSTRLLLQGSTDDSTYTAIGGTTASLQSKTLYGPRGEDAIFTTDLGNSDAGALPATVTYRYWRHWAAGTADPSRKWQHSKVMFGAWFDLGVDPHYPAKQVREAPYGRCGRELPLVYELTWSGITNTVRASFETSIGKRRSYMPVILYTKSYHDVLNEHRVLYGRIRDCRFVPTVGKKNRLTMVFQELI